MSTQNSGIAAQLIQGSRNISLMREGIRSLITGIFSFIGPGDCYVLGESRSKTFTEGGYEWRVAYNYSEQCFVVSCNFTEISPTGRTTCIRPVYSAKVYRDKKKESEERLHYTDVRCAYEGLDVLVTSMTDTFPYLSAGLEPIKDAAAVRL